MKLPTQVVIQSDGTTKTVQQKPGGAHVERFTAQLVASDAALADALTRMQKAERETAALAAANPLAASVLFRGLTAGTAGAKLTLPHGLGRAAHWAVVGWRGSTVTTAPILVDDSLDATPGTTTAQLVLRSYVAGILDVICF